jgi:hypothetical protein
VMGEGRLAMSDRPEGHSGIRKKALSVVLGNSLLLCHALSDSIGQVFRLLALEAHADLASRLELEALCLEGAVVDSNLETGLR